MKLWAWVIVLVLAAVGGGWLYYSFQPSAPAGPPQYLPEDTGETTQATTTRAKRDTDTAPRVEVIATQLEIPWEVLFLPGGEILVTERPGNLVLLKRGREIPVPGVRHVGEGGLLGGALHPDFSENRLLYLYQTTQSEGGLKNRIVRYRLVDDELTFDRTILNNIPGARYHDGGRIAFGPDGYLYVTVGDATKEEEAQDQRSLAGSILRVTADGEVPEDNPFNNPVYSYGHRNPQGLAWDEAGRIWSTEHGRSGALSGYDEVNLIERGGNYGWPEYQGDESAPGIISPVRHSGANTTWAPGSATYLNGSLYFAGLRGETLYEAKLNGDSITTLHKHMVGEYGRLRTITVGPDGLLYVTTSNRDGRTNSVRPPDDRLLRINPKKLNE